MEDYCRPFSLFHEEIMDNNNNNINNNNKTEKTFQFKSTKINFPISFKILKNQKI